MSWTYIISIASLIFCVFSFLYFRSYINKKTSFESTLKDVRDEVSRLLRSIDEITDKDITLIEDREKRLRELLEEADKRLAVLNRELDRRAGAEKAYQELGSKKSLNLVVPETPATPPEPVLSPEDQIRELARSGFSAPVIASRLGVSIAEAELAVAIHSRNPRDL